MADHEKWEDQQHTCTSIGGRDNELIFTILGPDFHRICCDRETWPLGEELHVFSILMDISTN